MAEPITIISIVLKATSFIKDNWRVLLPSFLAALLFPYFIYVIVTSILLPRIDQNIFDSYAETSRENEIDLAVLISYDTIRYFNDMEKALPNESVFDFLVIDWRVYEVEEVTKKREEVTIEENIVRQFTEVVDEVEIEMAVEKEFILIESGSSKGYDQIMQMLENKLFSYGRNMNDVTIPEVVEYLSDLDKTDAFGIDCYILSAEEIVSSFTRGEKLWFNGLSKMLAKMYPQFYESGSAPYAVIIEEGEQGDYVPSIWSVNGYVTGYFGELRSGGHIHKGIDIAAISGSNIYAPGSGTVILTGWQDEYGNTIMIHHGSGITTLYGHLKKILVRRGQIISRGEVIGLVGSTGVSTGPHLHYEIRINGKRVDPINYLP